jgi:hypothetical protein
MIEAVSGWGGWGANRHENGLDTAYIGFEGRPFSLTRRQKPLHKRADLENGASRSAVYRLMVY